MGDQKIRNTPLCVNQTAKTDRNYQSVNLIEMINQIKCHCTSVESDQ